MPESVRVGEPGQLMERVERTKSNFGKSKAGTDVVRKRVKLSTHILAIALVLSLLTHRRNIASLRADFCHSGEA